MPSAFDALPANSYILLLTPVLPPSTHAASQVDPYEPFGVSLNTRRRNLRHAPYVPTRGLTQLHTTFLADPLCGGVVAVLACTGMQGEQERALLEVGRWLNGRPGCLVVVTEESGGVGEGLGWRVVKTRGLGGLEVGAVVRGVFGD
ncbi:hypothetical protein EJ06DRAFT_559352 [Trichodelitschia bisporula]|uniref:Uncharacterized protein n=1 Tax=Trichodelitschia bisporula TaxID=703511 RepID=A0A6G1HMW6_9PEZI|nr:hypothetical protein EJ06DRAFT_559352 [Trichodelitschia bisporula]